MTSRSFACARGAAALGLVLAFPCLVAGQEALIQGHLQRPTNVAFHQGLLRDRSFKYSDDYFLTALSYRPRYPLRVLARLASAGYSLGVGSCSTSEFLLDQEARLRVPFADWLLGEFEFAQSEDYDERYLHATGEATVLVPGTGSAGVATPLTLLTNTPPPWGLFFGGSCELDAFKEFDDAGGFVGYRNRVVGGRLDVVFPEAFFTAKNRTGGKLHGLPLAFLAQVEAALSDEGPFFSAWLQDQPRVSGRFPAEGLRVGSVEKTRAGLEVVVPWDRTFVLALDATGEVAGKRRDFDATPARDDRFGRMAGQVWLESNFYLGEGRRPVGESPPDAARREPSDDPRGRPWGARPPAERGGIGPELSSRDAVVPRDVLARTTPANWATTDVLELGFFAQYLQEATQPRGSGDPAFAATARLVRREAYVQVGYFLTLPSILEGLALHPSAYVGYLHLRESSRDPAVRMKMADGVLAKVNAAVEYRFRDKAAVVGNLTFRLDEPQFGGGNVQVVFRF